MGERKKRAGIPRESVFQSSFLGLYMTNVEPKAQFQIEFQDHPTSTLQFKSEAKKPEPCQWAEPCQWTVGQINGITSAQRDSDSADSP